MRTAHTQLIYIYIANCGLVNINLMIAAASRIHFSLVHCIVITGCALFLISRSLSTTQCTSARFHSSCRQGAFNCSAEWRKCSVALHASFSAENVLEIVHVKRVTFAFVAFMQSISAHGCEAAVDFKASPMRCLALANIPAQTYTLHINQIHAMQSFYYVLLLRPRAFQNLSSSISGTAPE